MKVELEDIPMLVDLAIKIISILRSEKETVTLEDLQALVLRHDKRLDELVTQRQLADISELLSLEEN